MNQQYLEFGDQVWFFTDERTQENLLTVVDNGNLVAVKVEDTDGNTKTVKTEQLIKKV